MHFLKIRNGYFSFFRRSLRILLFILIILGSASIVSFPLWYWAIHGGHSFTWSVLLVIGGGGLFFLGKKVIRPSGVTGGGDSTGGLSLSILQRPALKLVKAVAALVSVYLTVLIFASFQALWGIVALLLTLYLIGLLFFR